MPGTQPRVVLKRRPWRTTEIESGPEPAFVKRFHDGRFALPALGRWRDRQRARNEARRLVELAAAGVPAPAVLCIAETPEGVELRLELLDRARSLEAELDDAGPGLARTLGELLARLHAAGYAHGDLHLGNVLVDDDRHAWVVDAAAIRRGTAARRARDLVQAAAEARERTSPRFRARFLLAYAAASGGERRAEVVAWAEALEGAARLARRARVARDIDRWLRDSGVAARHAEGGLAILAARPLERDAALDVARAALADRPHGPRGSHGFVRGRGARAAWLAQARLLEHRIAAARPLVLVERPTRCAVFAGPASARAPRAGSVGDARALGDLAGALFDRGLALVKAAVDIAEDGSAWVAPGAGLVDGATLSYALGPWRGPAGGADWTRSADFRAAFVAAQRGSRLQRDTLHALLAREP